jgi:hypothetical protein
MAKEGGNAIWPSPPIDREWPPIPGLRIKLPLFCLFGLCITWFMLIPELPTRGSPNIVFADRAFVIDTASAYLLDNAILYFINKHCSGCSVEALVEVTSLGNVLLAPPSKSQCKTCVCNMLAKVLRNNISCKLLLIPHNKRSSKLCHCRVEEACHCMHFPRLP